MNETLIEWISPEHHFDKKNTDWYWMLGIICIGVAVLSFYFDNFLFGVFIIIAGITLGILSYKETRTVDVRVTSEGIVRGKFLYPWVSYQSFWIEDDHVHGARLLLNSTKSFLPLTIIHIGDDIDLNHLRDIVLEFLEEEYMKESIVHEWFDRLIAR